jgi:uncharacterized repeat protein (TIGR03803 family)
LGYGAVYSLTRVEGQWVRKTLFAFKGGLDGNSPSGGLVTGPGGVVYGVTTLGGAFGNGTVYQLTPSGNPKAAWKRKILHSFTGKGDGKFPLGSLVLDSGSGALFGVTNVGGQPEVGVAYQLLPPAGAVTHWVEKIVHTFNTGGVGAKDGFSPVAGLIYVGGNLYGTTSNGGGSGAAGVVFKFSPMAGKWQETILARLKGGGPNAPFGPMTMISAAPLTLIGSSQEGGGMFGGNGTVFQLIP